MNWREQSRKIRERIHIDLDAHMEERLAYGAQNYPGDFQGDPIVHAREEVLDTLYYLHYAERQIAYLDQYRQALEEAFGPLTPEEARRRLGL